MQVPVDSHNNWSLHNAKLEKQNYSSQTLRQLLGCGYLPCPNIQIYWRWRDIFQLRDLKLRCLNDKSRCRRSQDLIFKQELRDDVYDLWHLRPMCRGGGRFELWDLNLAEDRWREWSATKDGSSEEWFISIDLRRREEEEGVWPNLRRNSWKIGSLKTIIITQLHQICL